MPLPDVIGILPLTKPVQAEVTVPGSKSITNRALILAALEPGRTTLHGALWSDDTQVMVDCLQRLGILVTVHPDELERCNRTIKVDGGGRVAAGGSGPNAPLELFVGNAGTTARFLAALVCLGQGWYRLHGVPRMHQRPQAALFLALRELGYRVEAPENKLPVLIQGMGRRPGHCQVSIEDSSQFASALLLCARLGGWSVEITGTNADESPYVEMTRRLVAEFPSGNGSFRVEPDASSGSYFWALNLLAPSPLLAHAPDGPPKPAAGAELANQALLEDGFSQRLRRWRRLASGDPLNGGSLGRLASLAGSHSWVAVADWPETGWQVDEAFPKFLRPPSTISRQTDLGDSIMTAIVLAPMASRSTRFTDLGRLRLQECERVAAFRTQLTRCGASVREQGDTLEILPAQLRDAEIETYEDHRIAMCFAILGLRVPGITLRNPSCVRKTFPDFFQKLAALPPHGIGATILDALGCPISEKDLFAA